MNTWRTTWIANFTVGMYILAAFGKWQHALGLIVLALIVFWLDEKGVNDA